VIELVVIGLAVAATIAVRVTMSRPPKAGVARALAAPATIGVVPNDAHRESLPTAARLLGTPPIPPLPEPARLEPPAAPLSLLGVESDREDDQRQLWLLARDRLANRKP
jgi:hypothetical protein